MEVTETCVVCQLCSISIASLAVADVLVYMRGTKGETKHRSDTV